ncbi:sugar kinase [Fictibacillus sp. B-59209]|uniref:sugar kinase n=1 Tax=Fictibacillus sp. B-59209 TaxID=3024873 RepID=UPI002E22B1E4|nr:sugar kinase [Fictibacillus sp. B-59209]
MAEILTLGEIVVEIMAKEVNQTFEQTGVFQGPYASGAPAIFINQAAKIGSKAGIISTIGSDAFGKLNHNKLREDGVDVSLISITDQLTTGVAFVTYKENGDREFIFHLQNSASSLIGPDNIQEEFFKECNYFHIMGSALFNKNIRSAVKKAIEICRRTNTKISFDPNIRRELLYDPEMRECLEYVLDHCDIFLPGGEELELLVNAKDEDGAIAHLFDKGIEYVVVKNGRKGCRAYSREGTFSIDPIQVVEVDPTGAGDCFGGTLISCLNKGLEFKESVIYANKAGALAVTKKGPMEGNTTWDQLREI